MHPLLVSESRPIVIESRLAALHPALGGPGLDVAALHVPSQVVLKGEGARTTVALVLERPLSVLVENVPI